MGPTKIYYLSKDPWSDVSHLDYTPSLVEEYTEDSKISKLWDNDFYLRKGFPKDNI